MGYFGGPADQYGVVVTFQAVKKVAGTCPLCEHPFAVTFTTEQEGGSYKEGDEYQCPCGGFRYWPATDHCTEDDHGVPEAEWKERLQKALKDLETAARAMAT